VTFSFLGVVGSSNPNQHVWDKLHICPFSVLDNKRNKREPCQDDPPHFYGLQSHTETQVLTVLGDFVSSKNASRSHLADLKTALAAAVTVNQVNAINWYAHVR